MTLAPDRTGYHGRYEVDEPEVHRLHIRLFGATEPPLTYPAAHEIDRARNVVWHHIATQCWEADHHGRYRNERRVHDLVSLDLGSPRLDFRGLDRLIRDWPIGGEFPTEDALSAYEYDTDQWLRDHGYTRDNRKA